MIAVRELNMVKFKEISENDYPQKPSKLKMITSGHGIFDCGIFALIVPVTKPPPNSAL